MEQYLVAIRNDDNLFYALADDVEALDELYTVHGIRREHNRYGIVACWKMLPPNMENKYGPSLPNYCPIPLEENLNADGV